MGGEVCLELFIMNARQIPEDKGEMIGRTSASVKSGSRPRKMTCGLGSEGVRRFLLLNAGPLRSSCPWS